MRDGIARRTGAHKARQIRLRITEVASHHGADFGVWHPFGHLVARMHVIDAVGMIGRLRLHAADDRELVGDLGHERQILADLHAGDVRLNWAKRAPGRPTRLEVECVDLASAAIHPQEDAAFAAPGRLLGDRLRTR